MVESESPPAAATAPAPPPPAAVLPALAMFERGDWAGATARARVLAADPDPAVQAAAQDLLARMAPDPWAFRVGLLALTLLAIVTGVYVR